ncbi:MAG: hypothetical protein ABFD50_12195 [Smithella sp.]
MMLKDSKGRTVVLKVNERNEATDFYAIDGDSLESVGEAIVCDGEDIFLTKEIVARMFKEAGFPEIHFHIDRNGFKNQWCPVQISGFTIDYEFCSFGFTQHYSQRKRICKINDKIVDEEVWNKASDALGEIAQYNGIGRSNLNKRDCKFSLGMEYILRMIGVGRVVTTISLMRGCAKDEDRPRLMPGDTVKVINKKILTVGVIRAINNKVSVQTPDGKKMSCDVVNLERIEEIIHDNQMADQIDPSIRDNFNFVIEESKKRIYRVKIEKGDFVYPLFPDTNSWGEMEKQIRKEDVATCVCPICGWTMSNICDSSTEFTCCYCRQKGQIISISDSEVSMIMSRSPAKNRFAIKEARCCGNCGRFEFEVGRQGKRSTGYCCAANQCLQAFNVCNLWFPRGVDRYESNIRQHVTNLHYGVRDHRNTDRNDIRDTVYTEEDHQKEVARAEEAKKAYVNAYNRFMSQLREEAKKVPMTEVKEMTEMDNHWKAVLDDPC